MTSLSYDSRNSRLLVFGGWANQWRGDIFALEVDSIVGPPYAITDIDPKMGPVTGKTFCRIQGIDFADNPVVRFRSGKHVLNVAATRVSSNEINVETPHFVDFPPGQVDVRVSCGGQSLTVTRQVFSIFTVADATKCLAAGPGIVSGCATGVPTCFIIQSRDATENNRITGSDEFEVRVIYLGEQESKIEDEEEEEKGQEKAQNVIHEVENVSITDKQDGTYLVTFTATHPGTHEISVEFKGTYDGIPGHVQGSPFRVSFVSGAPKENNTLKGPLMIEHINRQIRELSQFVQNTNNGLRADISNGNMKDLLQVSFFFFFGTFVVFY